MELINLISDNILSFEHLLTASPELIQKPECYGYGAVDDGVIMGVIMCMTMPDENGVSVQDLYVEEEKRRHGIGSMLIKAACDEAKQHGMEWMSIPFSYEFGPMLGLIDSIDNAQIFVGEDTGIPTAVIALSDEAAEKLADANSFFDQLNLEDMDIIVKLKSYGGMMRSQGITCRVESDETDTPCIVIDNDRDFRLRVYVYRGEDDDDVAESYLVSFYCGMIIDEVYLDEVKSDIDAAKEEYDTIHFDLNEKNGFLQMNCFMAEESGLIDKELYLSALSEFMSATAYVTPVI